VSRVVVIGENSQYMAGLNSKRIASLDGWRALSILLVIGSHSARVDGLPKELAFFFTSIFDGALGVRCFFIISGFIITLLLLKENDKTSKISLKKFYIRRSIRIIPVCYAYLFIVFLLQISANYFQSPIAWLQNLTFTTGYQFASAHYTWTTGHLWSLAVEEQFYILWPVLFYFFIARFNYALLVLSIPLFVSPIFRAVNYFCSEKIGWLFPTPEFLYNCDSISTGCICALIYFRWPQSIKLFLDRKNIFIIFTGLFLILFPIVLQKNYIYGFFTVPFANTSQNIGLALLLMHSIESPEYAPYRLLNSHTMQYIGKISFSLYIWQQLFTSNSIEFFYRSIWCFSYPWFIVCIFAAALFSYYLLEKPFMGLQSKYRVAN